MTTFTKNQLSASFFGQGVLISGTSSPGATVHTCISGTNSVDEVWLYATNNSASGAHNLTLEWTYPGSADYAINLSIPYKTGLTLVVPGLLLGSGTVSAYTDVSGIINVCGYVNTIQ